MIEQLQTIYTGSRWSRWVVGAGLLVVGALLSWLGGGFPPRAWRFLVQVIPLLPRLWSIQGPGVLLPFCALLLFSGTLFVLWTAFFTLALKLVQHWWHDYSAHQRFSQDLQDAEDLAERMAMEQEQREQREQALAQIAQQETQRQPAMMQPQRELVEHGLQRRYAVGESARGEVVERASSSRLHRTRLMPSSPSRPVSMREQLHLVPREEEDEVQQSELDEYDTLPIVDVDDDDEFDHLDTVDLIEESPIDQLKTRPNGEHDEEEEDALDERPLCFTVGIGLDTGVVRKNAPNEDNLFAVQGIRMFQGTPQPVGLFIVADGMGGHANGEEASRQAIQSVSDLVMPAVLRSIDESETFPELLKDAVHRANLALYQRNRQQQHPRMMMGTTLTAALLVGGTAYIVNVGDSRTYRYNAWEGLVQITRDHSLVARLVEEGAITHEQIYTHPQRNQIYRCLGERATIEVDTFTVPLHAGDVFLLCSDGLWEMVHDGDMQEIIAISVPHASQISSMLVQAALSRGGVDNVSVVAVSVSGQEE